MCSSDLTFPLQACSGKVVVCLCQPRRGPNVDIFALSP